MRSDAHQVPDGWQVVRLGDVVTMSQGGTPRKSRSEYWDGHIPFVTGADLTVFRVRIANARSFLTTEGLHSGDTVICQPGTLLLATRTAVGLAGIATETMGASQDITCLVTDGRVDADYLCRALVRLAPSLQWRSRGTTIQGITRDDARSLPILLPPLPEQRAIAAVLDSIDDAIERAEAVIAATERLRDALLHELLTRGMPGWHTEWKDAPGLGTIPAEWQVVRLGDECDRITKGTTPTTLGYEYTSSGVRFLRVENISDDGLIAGGELRFITDETHRALSRSILMKNDLVLSIAGALGRSALITGDILPANVNQALAIIRLAKGSQILPGFMSLALQGAAMQRQVNDMRVELAQANINLQQVGVLQIALPSQAEQRTIAGVLDGMGQRIERDREAWEVLQSLKASAADALLTGRVRVREIVGQTAEVT